MFASVVRLSLNDMAKLRVKDAYGIHRIVYGLFEPVRDLESSAGRAASSGILYSDRGMKKGWREIIVFSDRRPQQPNNGKLDALREITSELLEKLLGYSIYRFEITLNPVKREISSGKLVPLRTREAVAEWFAAKAPGWGFGVPHLEVKSIDVLQFEKKGQQVTLGRATLIGLLNVSDRELFAHSFAHGIGRAKAFGCGLLLIEPCSDPSTQPLQH
jgi:CRISPR system Cascade subunit CasE